MSMDPNDLSQGLGGDGAPAPGSPPGADVSAENAQLKEENAKLRADRRDDVVRAAIREHELTAEQALELARMGDLNQIKEKVEEFVKAKPAAPAAPAATGDPAPPADPAPPSTDPPNVAVLEGMQGGGDGAPVPPVGDQSLTGRMNAELGKATTLEEMQEIQNRYKREQMASNQ